MKMPNVEKHLQGFLWDHHLQGDPWGQEVQLHQRGHPLPSLLALLLDPGITHTFVSKIESKKRNVGWQSEQKK